MTRKVIVELYSPKWKVKFHTAVQELRSVFGELIVDVHHIGSTAVPGLSAKPIIDLCLVVRDIQVVDEFNGRLEEQRDWHVHTFQVGRPDIGRRLRFRDYLVVHPAEAQAYGRLKEELAHRFPHDIDSYMAGKDAFIKEIDQKALTWAKR